LTLPKQTTNLKQYVTAKLAPKKNIITTIGPNPIIASMEINLHMGPIQVQVGKNIIEDVLLDGISDMNITTKELWKQLRLPTPKPTPYTLQIANQTITKLVGSQNPNPWNSLHYVTFTIMKNNVLDSIYSMLLNQPWLRNALVTDDWGNNLITIEGTGTMQTIIVTKHLDNNSKFHEVLLCYNLMKGVINKEEILFAK
jgi:hypothetical protein